MKVTANGKTFTFPGWYEHRKILAPPLMSILLGQAVQQQTVNQANNAPTREEPSLMQQAGDWLTGGQSAGQIAEQAGRGLVNIPFDVLQGGASLINASARGLVALFWMMSIVQSIDRQTLMRKLEKQLAGISRQLAQRQKLLERQQSSQETSVPQET